MNTVSSLVCARLRVAAQFENIAQVSKIRITFSLRRFPLLVFRQGAGLGIGAPESGEGERDLRHGRCTDHLPRLFASGRSLAGVACPDNEIELEGIVCNDDCW
ncbi:MAG: hypothetical protein ABL984_09785, partial [Pyrinomonadaceae bacterium]